MAETPKSSAQNLPQGEMFSLDSLQASPQKAKYIPPRVRVMKSFDLSERHNIKWFMDTYDQEGNYQDDLHLYVREENKKYGDMGSIVNAKEDVNDEASPCITITTVPKGETTKANNISLCLDKWAPFDMTGSKNGNANSFAVLGMNISSFSSVQDSGVETYAQLVKGIKNAKGLLSINKKLAVKKKGKALNQERAMIQSQGKALVKSAIVHLGGGGTTGHLGGEGTTNSSKIISQKGSSAKDQSLSAQEGDISKAQDRSNLKNVLLQVEGSSEQGTKQQKTSLSRSKGKRSMSIQGSDDQEKVKRQKTDLLASSKELAIVSCPGPGLQIVEANENKALALLEAKKEYYPFGYEHVFSIDVLKCFPAPSHYVYRRLNDDWVKMLTRDLIEDTKFEEILGIVMPFDESTNLPLQALTSENISNASYWIISGQHSIIAAKRLQKSTLTKVTLQLRQQFRYRRCKIIVNCPPRVSREISKDANISVAKSMQKEPFLDQLLQARSQWIANGRPNKPAPGVNASKRTSKAWEDFVETTEHTLHKGFVRNDLHLLLCEDTIWKNWVLIMDTYARGGLPNTKGEMLDEEKSRIPTLKGGKIQQAPGTVALGPTLFRCICGLDSAEVITLQSCLLNKTIILKKGKQTNQMVDMEEFAWDMKVDKVLKVSIIDFFNDLTMETMTWDQICEKFKLTNHEYSQLKSYTHGFVKDCLNRTKKNPSLPKSAITLLHHLYRASMGQGTKEISTPWTIKGVGLDVQKLEAVSQQFHVSFQLAIMDARGFCEDLSMDTFSSITNCLNIMNSCIEYIIVCFVDFINIGCLVEGVRSQSGKVHYEVGTITKYNEQSITKGLSAYASVVLFVSKAAAFESIDKALGEKVFISTTASSRGDKIDADFISHLIEGFSPEQNYVLDLFSGGVVLQQCLMSKRHCIALCRDDHEAMTLEAKCSQIFEDNPQIQEWCGVQKSLKKQVIELNDDEGEDLDKVEIDVQPDGDDEDEEDDNDTQARSSSDEDEEGNIKEKPENKGVGQSNEDKLEDNENNQRNGRDDKQAKSGAEQCDKNKDKDKDKEDASYAEKSNEDKYEGEDTLNKDSNNADDSPKIADIAQNVGTSTFNVSSLVGPSIIPPEDLHRELKENEENLKYKEMQIVPYNTNIDKTSIRTKPKENQMEFEECDIYIMDKEKDASEDLRELKKNEENLKYKEMQIVPEDNNTNIDKTSIPVKPKENQMEVEERDIDIMDKEKGEDGLNSNKNDQQVEDLRSITQKSRPLGSLYFFERSGDKLVLTSSPSNRDLQLGLGDILLDEYGCMKSK